MLTRKRVRGLVTSITGWVLVVIGSTSVLFALGEASSLIAQIQSTWVPLPSADLSDELVLTVVSIVAACGGVLLIGLGRQERHREEEFRLDPLDYAPWRHPLRKVIPEVAILAAVLIVPGLFILPVAHSFSFDFEVTDCAPGATGSVHDVNLPAGAILAYSWHSSAGEPIGEVWAPTGPRIGSNWAPTYAFYNSSSGYSVLQSNGTSIPFWACNFPYNGASASSVTLSGTYYLPAL